MADHSSDLLHVRCYQWLSCLTSRTTFPWSISTGLLTLHFGALHPIFNLIPSGWVIMIHPSFCWCHYLFSFSALQKQGLTARSVSLFIAKLGAVSFQPDHECISWLQSLDGALQHSLSPPSQVLAHHLWLSPPPPINGPPPIKALPTGGKELLTINCPMLVRFSASSSQAPLANFCHGAQAPVCSPAIFSGAESKVADPSSARYMASMSWEQGRYQVVQALYNTSAYYLYN